jgi:hypothetical protein
MLHGANLTLIGLSPHLEGTLYWNGMDVLETSELPKTPHRLYWNPSSNLPFFRVSSDGLGFEPQTGHNQRIAL